MDGGGDGGGDGGVHRRKPTNKRKQPHKKNKPLKVVYISNPMRFQISACEFMSLVQQFTGQHADFPDPSKFHSAVATAAANDGDDDANLLMNDDSPNSSLGAELLAEDDFLSSFYDDFDELIFPPPMIGDFTGLLPAAPAAER